MPSSPTISGTPRLSELARHVVAPEGITSTGWPAVQAKALDMGVRFRPWQIPVGRLILAKRADGKYAATIGGTGLSIPRQVGKTFLVAAIVFALCLLRPGLTVVWTAHRLSTAEETFGKLRAFAKRRRIAPFIQQVFTGSGDEEVRFRNGSRILFGARERGFGRGFDEVDVLIFDEAQILGDNALDDMIPATNQSRQDTGALLLYMGTPPKPADKGEAFTRMRTEALSGEDRDTGWVEFAGDPGYKPADAPAELTAADWAQVAKANPSYPMDTPREAILRMRKKLGAESFLREGLGIWDEVGTGIIRGWDALLADAPDDDPVAFGLDMTWGREWVSVAVAVNGYVDVVEHLHGPDGLEDVLTRLHEAHPSVKVCLDPKGPAGPLVDVVKAAKMQIREVSGDEYKRACGGFFDAVAGGKLHHSGHPALDAAVRGAAVSGGSGGWVWDRKKGAVISPLVAATVAWWVSERRVDVSENVW